MMEGVDRNDKGGEVGDVRFRKFPCKTCPKAFTKSEHLARHERSHMKQRPFTCSHCYKSFGRQDVLARHAKLHDASTSDVATQQKSKSVSPERYSRHEQGTPSGSNHLELHGHQTDRNPSTLVLNETKQPVDLNFSLGPSQQWNGSEDLLELLMSDFSSNWPVTLPIVQTQPRQIQGATLSPTAVLSASPGHQAMQQMSRLIADLSTNLTAEIESTGITSAFLDTCMHVFFERFIPSFPVLHKPTFSPRECSNPLLLNIIALGSLFVGAKDAIYKGEALWRLAHTAVATSWQALMATRGPRDTCNGVQLVLTALLGQTYAILSKNESLRMTSQIFHGLGFYWARQCGMYSLQESELDEVPSLNTEETEKVEMWKNWATREVRNRAVLGHYVLDGQISQFSGFPACARHVTNPLLEPESDAAFAATSPDAWIIEMQKRIVQRRSLREIFIAMFSPDQLKNTTLSNFSVRIVLEGLQSLASDVQEANDVAIGTPSRHAIIQALMHLHTERLTHSEWSSVESMELLVRWHSICLGIATPTAILCRKLCKFYGIRQNLYPELDAGVIGELDLVTWSRSIDGLRALLHAIAIQDIIERLPLGRSHAIHLPAAIFSIATVYSARCLASLPALVVPKSIRWQDVWSVDIISKEIAGNPLGVDKFLQSTLKPGEPNTYNRNLLYDLNSIQITLSSIASRWGVSTEMDDILQQWITIVSEGTHSNV